MATAAKGEGTSEKREREPSVGGRNGGKNTQSLCLAHDAVTHFEPLLAPQRCDAITLQSSVRRKGCLQGARWLRGARKDFAFFPHGARRSREKKTTENSNADVSLSISGRRFQTLLLSTPLSTATRAKTKPHARGRERGGERPRKAERRDANEGERKTKSPFSSSCAHRASLAFSFSLSSPSLLLLLKHPTYRPGQCGER